MGPVRGYKKRRKVEPNASASGSSEEGSVDWWDVFSKRIAGNSILQRELLFYINFGCMLKLLWQNADLRSTPIPSLNAFGYGPKINIDTIKKLRQCLLSPSEGSDKFESVFKISRKTFNYICSLVKEHMMARSANFVFSNGMPMSLNDRVAVALRRLGSGDSLISVADSFGTNHSTVSQVTWRFVEAIEENGLHHLQWPSVEQEMTDVKSKFERLRGFPNCCGAIDTTHITMLLSSSEMGSNLWLDREKNHSMILQAIVDPDMRFRDIVTGWPGKMNDFDVLQSSTFFKLCEKGERLKGHTMKLSDRTELNEYIVGDSGFPLLPWLVTPYQGKELSESEFEFNKRHFATRIVAQRALARLRETWKIIQGVMWRPDKHRLPRIILACCILHNIVIDMEDEVLDALPLSHHHDTGYKHEVCESADKAALVLRDKLSLYLSGRLLP